MPTFQPADYPMKSLKLLERLIFFDPWQILRRRSAFLPSQRQKPAQGPKPQFAGIQGDHLMCQPSHRWVIAPECPTISQGQLAPHGRHLHSRAAASAMPGANGGEGSALRRGPARGAPRSAFGCSPESSVSPPSLRPARRYKDPRGPRTARRPSNPRSSRRGGRRGSGFRSGCRLRCFSGVRPWSDWRNLQKPARGRR